MYNVLGYIDDMFGSGCDLEDVYKSLESFLITMSHFELLANPRKANLVSKSVNFLGYTIREGSILRIKKNRITDIRQIKSPKTKDELRSLMGIFSWYSHRAKLRDSLRGMRELCKGGGSISVE